MTLYAVTIFLSAFLLFQVQPLIAKIILPWFGGSAAVWSAAMLFFQLLLLGGYAYAHVLIRIKKPKTQIGVHATLLVVSWLASADSAVAIMEAHAGRRSHAAYFAAVARDHWPAVFPAAFSATSPLLQAWYVRRSGCAACPIASSRSPALVDAGALELPLFGRATHRTSRQQAFTWSGIYIAFALLCAAAAWVSRNEAPVDKFDAKASPEPAIEAVPGAAPGFGQILLWVALAACASTLLVSVTNHMSQNLAPIPLLWVVPLALYLATFILAFESDRIYNRWIFLPLLIPVLAAMAYYLWSESGRTCAISSGWSRVTHLGLFICCMMCHGRARPPQAGSQVYLTLFYLMISLGGCTGRAVRGA